MKMANRKAALEQLMKVAHGAIKARKMGPPEGSPEEEASEPKEEAMSEGDDVGADLNKDKLASGDSGVEGKENEKVAAETDVDPQSMKGHKGHTTKITDKRDEEDEKDKYVPQWVKDARKKG